MTDAVQNPGNSGGPWITRGGDVVALAESGPPFDRKSEQPAQGTNGGVLASVARSRYDDWRRIPEAPSPVSCPGGVGNEASVESRALQTLDQYYFDINNSDYDSAYAQLDPANRDLSLEAYRRGIQTSQFGAPDGRPYDLDGISSDGNSVVADVRTRTHQDPAYGRDRPARTGTRVTSSSRVPESG